jgi:hypothetical protein
MALISNRRRVAARYIGMRGLVNRRGMGCGCSQTDESGNCLDSDPCGGSVPISTDPNQTVLSNPFGIPYPAAGSGSASSPSSLPMWTSLANSITSDFSSIFKTVQPIPAGCTQMTSPTGQSYVSCSATGAAPQPGSLNFGGSSIGMGTLVIGGLLLFALMAHGGRG